MRWVVCFCRGSALAVHAHTYELFSRRFVCAAVCSVHRGAVDGHSSAWAADGIVVASLRPADGTDSG